MFRLHIIQNNYISEHIPQAVRGWAKSGNKVGTTNPDDAL